MGPRIGPRCQVLPDLRDILGHGFAATARNGVDEDGHAPEQDDRVAAGLAHRPNGASVTIF
jgi:hypothetical protein